MKSLSRVLLFATPWTVAHQASQSMGFSMQEYWSGLPFPSRYQKYYLFRLTILRIYLAKPFGARMIRQKLYNLLQNLLRCLYLIITMNNLNVLSSMFLLSCPFPLSSLSSLSGSVQKSVYLMAEVAGSWEDARYLKNQAEQSPSMSSLPFVVIVQLVSCIWLFVTPMDCSMPGSSVLHYLPEFAQIHVHWVGDAI